MAMWGRMPLPPIPICPQEPWEAQEYAHRDRIGVKFSFCGRPKAVPESACAGSDGERFATAGFEDPIPYRA